MSLDPETTARVLRVVHDEATVLLFGSHARGDATPKSDIDVLVVTSSPREPYSIDEICVSVYTRDRLVALARSGNLFVKHLCDEAIALRDPHQTLSGLRSAFVPSLSYAILRMSVFLASGLLDVDEREFAANRSALATVTKHLIRSYCYATLADRRDLAFPWDQALQRTGGQELRALPTSPMEWCYVDFERARAWLWRQFGARCRNASGSLEAYVTNASAHSELAVVMGLKLLGRHGHDPYEDVADAIGLP